MVTFVALPPPSDFLERLPRRLGVVTTLSSSSRAVLAMPLPDLNCTEALPLPDLSDLAELCRLAYSVGE